MGEQSLPPIVIELQSLQVGNTPEELDDDFNEQ